MDIVEIECQEANLRRELDGCRLEFCVAAFCLAISYQIADRNLEGRRDRAHIGRFLVMLCDPRRVVLLRLSGAGWLSSSVCFSRQRGQQPPSVPSVSLPPTAMALGPLDAHADVTAAELCACAECRVH